MAHLEGAYEQMNQRLGSIEGRLTAIDQKIDTRFDTLDKKLNGMLFAWLGSTVAIIGIVLTHH